MDGLNKIIIAVERIREMENAYEEITKNLKSKPYRI